MVIIKTNNEIKKIKKSCQLTAHTLQYITEKVRPGIRTIEIDRMAESFIIRSGGKPSFKGYGTEGNEFPATVCISINDEIVHGIPGERVLQEGDIVSLDMGAYLDGYYSDSAVTVGVGNITKIAQKLIDTTKESLFAGIRNAISGNFIGDIGHAIQTVAENNNFSVVREFVGHGVGLEVHEDPQIPNYGRPKTGLRLEEGMVIAIEPMVNQGDYHTISDDDGWTVKTADGSLSAHFEHTIAIYDKGNEILTIWD